LNGRLQKCCEFIIYFTWNCEGLFLTRIFPGFIPDGVGDFPAEGRVTDGRGLCDIVLDFEFVAPRSCSAAWQSASKTFAF
jgi:hypothetical protein